MLLQGLWLKPVVTGGDYDKAKEMLDSSPANYGSGSPFKLMRSKIFKK
jgi:hypothetical protein